MVYTISSSAHLNNEMLKRPKEGGGERDKRPKIGLYNEEHIVNIVKTKSMVVVFFALVYHL